MVKKIFQRIPLLPLSALIVYLGMLILWKLGHIPGPADILSFLESLYDSYGLIGVFIASFLEGIVYLGFYFPGSFIAALAIILSDGSFKSIFSIVLVVAIALTITSMINYLLGREILAGRFKESSDKNKVFSKGLLTSMLHPNALALYFFSSGIKKRSFLKIFIVPFIIVPYGLVLGYILYSVKEPIRAAIESPYILLSLIIIWFLASFFFQGKRKTAKKQRFKPYAARKSS